jgi:hypothetical protein
MMLTSGKLSRKRFWFHVTGIYRACSKLYYLDNSSRNSKIKDKNERPQDLHGPR